MEREIDNTEADQSGSQVIKEQRDINFSLLFRLILGVVILTLFAVFALQNSESAEVSFLSSEFNLSLIVIMLGSAATGVIVWEMAKFIDRRRKS